MKRLLILGLLAVCSIISGYAYDFEVDGIYYNKISDYEVEVTYKTYISASGSGYGGVVEIPSSIIYDDKMYHITSIGQAAFSSCSGLTSITIPNSVTSIGDLAFWGCSGLISITIPNSVTSIGDKAFGYSTSLASVTIGNSVMSIGNSAFRNCNSLTSITIPNSVTSIGYSVFERCSSLTYVTIGNSVTSIGFSAFSGCTNLTSITIPNSVTSIGHEAFMDCTSLGSVTIGNYVKTIEYSAFSGCTNLTSINIPNSVSSIGNYAFQDCSGLTSITIPNSVTSIGYSIFYNCSSLTYVTIGNSVTSIGSSAFSGCTNLTSITIPNSVASIGDKAFMDCTSLGSVTIGNYVKTIKNSAFSGCTNLTSINIPNSVTSIGGAVFEDCSSLTSVTIGNSVRSIGGKTFSGCTSLTSITIPNSVTSIENSVFSGCTSLTSVTIGNYVTNIGDEVFAGCSGLTSVTIGNSVKSIGSKVFHGCNALTSIIVSSGNTKYDSRNNSNAIIETSSSTLLFGCKNTAIPNSVTSIGEYAFYGCSSLTSITIPNSVMRIGERAFADCSGLTSVTIGNSVTSIGGIGSYSAFANCSGLASVIVSSGNTKYDSRNNCNAIIETSSSILLFGCKNTAIPNSVTSIGEYAFYHCSGLTSITLPNSVTSIGGLAFYHCSALASVVSEIHNPFSIDYDVFSYISSEAILQVPKGTKSKYEAFPGWTKNFKEIVERTSEATNYTLSIIATGDGSVSYNGITIRNNTQSFTVNEGTNATITFSPDNGYRIGSVMVNSSDVTYWVSNNKYSINNISSNTTVEVEFEAIPVTTYSLSISASGNGYVSYNGSAIRNRTTSFTVDEGTSATVTFSPDNGNSIACVKLNDSDITSQISGNSYTINNITANTTLAVTFQEDVNALTVDGLNYTVTSQSNKTVTLTSGGTGLVLTVPATITKNGTTWKVTGIDKDALKGNTELAAIIWNPEAVFIATVSNPNLLLYVKSSDYAPATIQNVVVNGTASNIVLTEAQSGNNFYCPQSFVAQKISYTHNYQMQTGIGEARGWETIALPFEVQTITHATKGEIKPFANWKSGDAAKPFWLYELAGTGFVETGSIKAYTPYIISMPNNPQYDSQWLLNGKVTFVANSVTIGKTEDLVQPTFNGRTFIPCFAEKESSSGLYALNVNNDFETNNSGMTEGSWFVLNKRNVHPFEAYMTSFSSAPQHAFGVFEDMTTGIRMMINGSWTKEEVVYDLQGRKVNAPSKKGVYIVNGKKKIIK